MSIPVQHPIIALDTALERLGASRMSRTEEDLLWDGPWRVGEDVRLREDLRFRSTPWGQWIRSLDYLANEAVVRQLRQGHQGKLPLHRALEDLEELTARRCVMCGADPRLVIDDETVCLSAKELSDRPLIETEVDDLAKFRTHLPLHDLAIAAACTRPPNWSALIHEQTVETIGWLEVQLPKRRLSDRLFVARVVGHSMDGGKQAIRDGDFCVFEYWPVGTKSNNPYLVRGSFNAPETGWYALKQIHADQRDAEGEHRWMELVSWNPDMERYPPIRIDAEEAEDLSFVAELVTVLQPPDFRREPKPRMKTGRRDTSSRRARESVQKHLAEYGERFFAEAASDPDSDKPDTQTWGSSLVCLDGGAGGLHLELTPLPGLWSFVKRLRLRGRDWDAQVLASNARLRPTQIAVPPASGPWSVDAVGFEDDPDVDLSMLTLPGIDRPALMFRVDAAGTGRLVAGDSVAPGQHYRILLSPVCWGGLKAQVAEMELSAGWRLIELAIGWESRDDVKALLVELGIAVGNRKPSLLPLSVPPKWRANAQGTLYPCYEAGRSAVVAVDGLSDDDLPGASVFIHGNKQLYALHGLEGDRLLEIRDAAEGQYICSLVHEQKAISRAYLPFAVISSAPCAPSAACSISIGSKDLKTVPGTRVESGLLDLADAAVEASLELKCPPGWCVAVSWKDLACQYLGQVHADAAGCIAEVELFGMFRERCRQYQVGDVVLDFGELGVIVLRHRQERSPAVVRQKLTEAIDAKRQTVLKLTGQFTTMLQVWLEPLCSILGYQEVVSVPDQPEPPGHAVAYSLVCVRRSPTEYVHSVPRLLILVENVQATMGAELLAWCDELCAQEDVREMLLCDGLRWALRKRKSKLSLHVHDLGELSDTDEELNDFLRDAGEDI
jgi:hypothetical protein